MERTAVNPWDWSIKLGYNQAEIIDGAARQVVCAGQTAVDGDGAPQHPAICGRRSASRSTTLKRC